MEQSSVGDFSIDLGFFNALGNDTPTSNTNPLEQTKSNDSNLDLPTKVDVPASPSMFFNPETSALSMTSDTTSASNQPLAPPPEILMATTSTGTSASTSTSSASNQPIPMPAEISNAGSSSGSGLSTPIFNAPPSSQPLNQQQLMQLQQQRMMQMQRLQQQQQQMMQAQAFNSINATNSARPNPNAGTTNAQSMTTTWQSERDIPQRRNMISRIVQLLQQRKPDAPNEWLAKLPDMAKRLEDSLYRTAKSAEEYNNISSLRERLQRLAMTMGNRSGNSNQKDSSSTARSENSASQAIAMPPDLAGPPVSTAPMSNASNIASTTATSSNLLGVESNSASAGYSSQPLMPPSSLNIGNANPGSGGGEAANRPQATPQQRQHILRQQQQRLLLLRHANKCQAPPGTCRATPHCASMKKLWEHILHCRDQRCQVSHCVSSRYVLLHYENCRNPQCAVCSPVREAILRHNSSNPTAQGTTQSMGSMSQPVSQQMVATTPPSQAKPAQGQNQTNSANAAQKMKEQIVQAVQAKAATMSNQQLGQLFSTVRAQLHQLTQNFEIWKQQASYAIQLYNTSSPRSKAQKQQDATAKRAHVINAKQKITQLQIQLQALGLVIQKRTQSNSGNVATMGNGSHSQLSQQQQQERAIAQAKAQQAKAQDAQLQQAQAQQAKIMQMKQRQEEQRKAATLRAQQNSVKTESKPLEMPPDLVAEVPVKKEPAPAAAEPAAQGATANKKRELETKDEDSKAKDALKKLKVEDTRQESTSTALTRPKYTAEGTSMLSQFTNEEIQLHLDSLQKGFCSSNSVSQLKVRLVPLLKKMMDHDFGWVFNTPVDPVALSIPDYFTIVKHPMDLGTVKKRLEGGYYKHIDTFAAQVRLTFENAMLYNEEDSDVYNLARDMLVQFGEDFDSIKQEIDTEERQRREGENACRLCGGERFLFEPLVFYCNGPCNSRIRRNSYYYSTTDNKYHWCQPCYNELKEDKAIPAGDSTVKKAELGRKKNDEINEEPWVQCDKCNRWVHQVCVLFNGRNADENGTDTNGSSKKEVVKQEKKSNEKFYCPICLLELRRSAPERVPIKPKALAARELPRTKLSDFIEARIARMLRKRREEDAKVMNKPLADVPTVEGLVIRQVSNVERQLMVRDRMYQRYKESNQYPAEFRFKSKCLCMFQELDAVPTLLFGMYVHEFDEQEPEPNNRRVYVSYLDSVHYLNPPTFRTVIYHEILIAYLDYVKRRGFTVAHIWACPPLKGDDYILYCHPEDQRTPKSDRLRQWYVTMLMKAQEEGIVTEISNIYTEFWRRGNGAYVLPYFEGDYWVGIAEEFCKSIEEDKKKGDKKKGKSAGSSKKSSKKKKRKPSSGVPTCGGSSFFSEEDSVPIEDELMLQLGEVLEPMRDDFLVVRLGYNCVNCRKGIIKGNRWKDQKTSTSIGLNPESIEYNICDECHEKKIPSSTSRELVAVPVKVREKCTDPDETIESDFFDTRQAFLSLCQGNHYQFDQLRRAKHTSLMVLYHLHNPTAPAYIYVCNECQADITSGNRWHCDQCNDFDVCDTCNAKIKHQHKLNPIAVRETTKETNAATRQARESRARSIQLHMQLLVHASACNNKECPSANCGKMKALLKHGAACTTRATGGCNICRRIWALLQIHARQCRQHQCPVPRCKDLKEHLRRLQMQQQQMDDRRRAAVTEHYRQQQSDHHDPPPSTASIAPPTPSALKSKSSSLAASKSISK